MEYRLATEHDTEELIKLRLAYLEEDLGNVIKEEVDQISNELASYYKKHLGKELIVFVAADKGQVVATAYLLIIEMPASPNFITGRIGDVLSVYTKKEYRKKGIGGELIERLIKEGREKELSYIELSATKDGHPLYKKKGFTDHVSEYKQMRYYIDE